MKRCRAAAEYRLPHPTRRHRTARDISSPINQGAVQFKTTTSEFDNREQPNSSIRRAFSVNDDVLNALIA
jgi:hypothetical protein